MKSLKETLNESINQIPEWVKKFNKDVEKVQSWINDENLKKILNKKHIDEDAVNEFKYVVRTILNEMWLKSESDWKEAFDADDLPQNMQELIGRFVGFPEDYDDPMSYMRGTLEVGIDYEDDLKKFDEYEKPSVWGKLLFDEVWKEVHHKTFAKMYDVKY